MFHGKGFRGRILNKALHSQHQRIYCYDKTTQYGSFPNPSLEMTTQFLEMVHWDEGGRLFTFVLTSDALFRCCETGKEFAIDLLSKHTMHSDVDVYIAWSGEFLVRRLAKPGTEEKGTHPSDDIPGGPPKEKPGRIKDPKYYELVIDNDSGTYRPNADLIPIFKKFLEANLPGLKIVVKPCTDDKLQAIKTEQREAKKREGPRTVVVQGSDDEGKGNWTSSDESDLDDAEEDVNEEDAKDGGAGGEGVLGKTVGLLEDPKGAIKDVLHRTKTKE